MENKQPLTDTVSKLHHEHKERLEELERSFKEKKDELSEVIKKYPITSVLAALGIGFVIGKIFSSRK